MIQESLPRPIENFVANLSANQFNVNAHLAPAGSSLGFSLQTMKFEGEFTEENKKLTKAA
jgi:hypothetical protein